MKTLEWGKTLFIADFTDYNTYFVCLFLQVGFTLMSRDVHIYHFRTWPGLCGRTRYRVQDRCSNDMGVFCQCLKLSKLMFDFY